MFMSLDAGKCHLVRWACFSGLYARIDCSPGVFPLLLSILRHGIFILELLYKIRTSTVGVGVAEKEGPVAEAGRYGKWVAGRLQVFWLKPAMSKSFLKFRYVCIQFCGSNEKLFLPHSLHSNFESRKYRTKIKSVRVGTSVSFSFLCIWYWDSFTG